MTATINLPEHRRKERVPVDSNFELRASRSELIYYRDEYKDDTRVSHFQLWQMPDAGTIEVLEAALGMRVMVRKRRELWHRDNIKFNLDEVEGVGRIFELEAQDMVRP